MDQHDISFIIARCDVSEHLIFALKHMLHITQYKESLNQTVSRIKHGIPEFFDEQDYPTITHTVFILKAIISSQEATQHNKLQAEIVKLITETSKIISENRWHPVIVGASATLAIVAVVKNFL